MKTVTYRNLMDANEARQKEWDPGKVIDASYRGNELAGETGEACNVIKKLERERLGIRGSRATIDQLADELADVICCASLIALHYGIDLDAATVRKFNAVSERMGLATRLDLSARVPLHLGVDLAATDDDGDLLEQCLSCAGPVKPEDPQVHTTDGDVLCGECSPTWSELAENLVASEEPERITAGNALYRRIASGELDGNANAAKAATP